MADKTSKQHNVEKAYATRIMLDHSRWAKDPTPEDGVTETVKKDRFCVVCKEVLTVGYDPTEVDVAGHVYEKLLEAGMIWPTSPAIVDGQHIVD